MKTCNRIAVALLHMTLFRPLSPKILSDSPPLQTSLLFYAFTDSATRPLMSFRLNFGSTWIITQIPHVLRWVFCLHMNMDFGSPQSALYGNTLDLSLPAESTWAPSLVEAHTALHTFFFLGALLFLHRELVIEGSKDGKKGDRDKDFLPFLVEW